MVRIIIAVVVVLLGVGCSTDTVPTGRAPTSSTTTSTTLPDLPPLKDLRLVEITDALDHPVSIAPAPGIGDTFVVERTGRVTTLTSGATEVVLDITPKVGWEISEQGFLGFAVHPGFPDDPRAFAVYTNIKENVVVTSFEWDGASSFSPRSEQLVLEVPQPHFYHQGGGIAFGPYGYLWLSFGDGGGVGDKFDNGQNTRSLNGTVVRIDVDSAEPYAIPPSNPFVDGEGGAQEIWAYGLRNAWRITIDRDRIYIADVGQQGQEEINVASIDDAGLNFGWSIMEGNECFESDDCNREGLVLPELAIDRDRVCAVIGGPVYRGVNIVELHGHYIFGDHCFGWMRSAPVTDDGLGDVVNWEPKLGQIGNITTFGLDHTGELLVATLDGHLYRIDPVR